MSSPECRTKIPLRCGKTMPNKQTQPSLNISHVRNCYPLQYSCLENPRDGGAWWAAVYGVAQSRTWLKRLSSSSSGNKKLPMSDEENLGLSKGIPSQTNVYITNRVEMEEARRTPKSRVYQSVSILVQGPGQLSPRSGDKSIRLWEPEDTSF